MITKVTKSVFLVGIILMLSSVIYMIANLAIADLIVYKFLFFIITGTGLVFTSCYSNYVFRKKLK